MTYEAVLYYNLPSPSSIKVSKFGSTLINYNIKMLLHAFVGDKNRLIQYSEMI